MPLKTVIHAIFISLMLSACAASQPLSPHTAQQILLKTWQADQHIVWELDWPAAPVGGALTVETWRSGNRYRFEILEAVPPALVGQTLVFDGNTARHYNRFEPPVVFAPAPPVLSPVSDAFFIVDSLVNEVPATAVQENAQVNFTAAHKITVTYPNGNTLTMWQNIETGLPERLTVSVNGSTFTLNARQSNPLPNPPEYLFTVGEWVR